ncbi:MAG: E3 binding domain-containing protein, partial [Chloroflexota bacterium]|nr:E3 binding domain-containing protein [Chloroflexota bacterium]
MPTPVTMPRLGESVAEGTVGSWLKKEGDWVERDESLAEIITDKINAELPSPVAGRLAKILVQPDETVSVGTEIALIEENADVSASPPAEAAPGPDAAPVKSIQQAETPVFENTNASAAQSATTGQTTAPVNESGEAAAPMGNGASAAKMPAPSTEEERQRISPLARRMAREQNVDLNQIAGTGTGGRVRKEDILSYVAQQQAAPAAVAAPPQPPQAPSAPRPVPTPARPPVAAPPPQPAPTYTAPVAQQTRQAQPTTAEANEDVEVVTPTRMRLAIAEHMVRSKRTSPHATTVVEVDMTNIAKWLEKNKAEFKQRNGYGISFVPFVMKAV